MDVKPCTELSSIEHLCDLKAWSDNRLSRRLYMPFGFVLALSRILIVLTLSAALVAVPRQRKGQAFRLLRWILGLRLTRSMTPQDAGDHTNGCVVACNHVSILDIFLVSDLPHATILVADPLKGGNPLIVFLGYLVFRSTGCRVWTMRNKRELIRQLDAWRKQPDGCAVYVTPEATINNGKGLFRFEPALLTRGMPVVPATVRLKTPLGLNPHPLHGSGAANVFRLLMMPHLHYEMACLPRMVQEPWQDPTAFSAQIQNAVAAHLGITATSFTRKDKALYRKNTRWPARKS